MMQDNVRLSTSSTRTITYPLRPSRHNRIHNRTRKAVTLHYDDGTCDVLPDHLDLELTKTVAHIECRGARHALDVDEFTIPVYHNAKLKMDGIHLFIEVE
jgi:hypothetical protein